MGKTAVWSLVLVGLLVTGCDDGDRTLADGNNDRFIAGERTAEKAGNCAPLQGFFSELLSLTNQARAEVKVPPLRFSFQLGQSAQRGAADLAVQDFFSHVGEDGSTYVFRIDATGYSAGAVGENLIAGYETAAQAFDGWMNSESHRQNILHRGFSEVGFGVFDTTGKSTYGRYWVQHLGRPQTGASEGGVYIPEHCGWPVAGAEADLAQGIQATVPVNVLAARVAGVVHGAEAGAGVGAEPVPEPTVIFGLVALTGLLWREARLAEKQRESVKKLDGK
ncbi:MAG: CAP domain-containing protein [Cyanobacteria bacterium J06623_5]